MNKNILLMVDVVSNEKGVEKEIIFQALEAALASATKKRYSNDERDVRVKLDRTSGHYETGRGWLVMDDEDPNFESPERHILFTPAQDKKSGSNIGEYIEERLENVEFGRISAQTAKQVIVQKVREAERAQ